jgi:hypothetical protein
MTDDLERLDADYERAEAAFLDAVRRDCPRAELAETARAVAAASASWNSEAHRRLFAAERSAREELDRLSERTEVLSELWADLAKAFEA